MAKHKIDQVREERIEIEIVVDCYNESERYSAWICYLEDKLEFPFRARCVAARKYSPLKSGEKVEIVSMLDEDCDEPSEIFVQARWQGRELGLPLAQAGRHRSQQSDRRGHRRLALLARPRV